MTGPVPSTQTVLDLLALAFSKSGLREGVTRELLAEKLEPVWDMFIKKNVLYLERVWEVAKERPDFDAKRAMVPLCFFKLQERRLGVMVELPADMKHLSSTDQATHAALCPVKRDELDKVLGPMRTVTPVDANVPPAASSRRMTPVPGSGKSLPPKTRETQPVAFTPPAAKEPPDRRRRAVIAGVLGVLAVGFLLVSVSRSCGGPANKWEQIAAEEFKGIPVREPQRLGNQVVATLTDEKWLDQPEEARRRQLIEVLEGMSKRNVQMVALRGGDARVRASVQWGGSPRHAVVKFPR